MQRRLFFKLFGLGSLLTLLTTKKAEAAEWVETGSTFSNGGVNVNSLMQVQHRIAATLSNAGAGVIGENLRIFNTVLINNIAGASLSGNMVSLPAGKYMTEVDTSTNGTGFTRLKIKTAADVVLIYGVNYYAQNISGVADIPCNPKLSGYFELAIPTTIKVISKFSRAGQNYDFGTRNEDIFDIFADWKIWKVG